jgi:hypothetical protein
MNPVSRNIELKTIRVHSLSTQSLLVSTGLKTEWPVVIGSPYNLLSLISDRAQPNQQVTGL